MQRKENRPAEGCGYRGSGTEKVRCRSMIRTTMKIEGMMCAMCEAHICDAIRKTVPDAKKVTASRSRKEAAFLTEETPDAAALKAAIDATGYSCLGVESEAYEKKGLFGRR